MIVRRYPALSVNEDAPAVGEGAGRVAVERWAASGAMALTGTADEPLGPPAGLVAGVDELGRSFPGLDTLALLGERAALMGLWRRGSTSCGGSCRLFAAREGWLAVSLPRAEDLESVPAWLELDEPPPTTPAIWSAVSAAVATRDPAELVERAVILGLPVSRVAEAAGPAVVDVALGEAAPGDARRSPGGRPLGPVGGPALRRPARRRRRDGGQGRVHDASRWSETGAGGFLRPPQRAEAVRGARLRVVCRGADARRAGATGRRRDRGQPSARSSSWASGGRRRGRRPAGVGVDHRLRADRGVAGGLRRRRGVRRRPGGVARRRSDVLRGRRRGSGQRPDGCARPACDACWGAAGAACSTCRCRGRAPPWRDRRRQPHGRRWRAPSAAGGGSARPFGADGGRPRRVGRAMKKACRSGSNATRGGDGSRGSGARARGGDDAPRMTETMTPGTGSRGGDPDHRCSPAPRPGHHGQRDQAVREPRALSSPSFASGLPVSESPIQSDRWNWRASWRSVGTVRHAAGHGKVGRRRRRGVLGRASLSRTAKPLANG